jgi:hypothetical protein
MQHSVEVPINMDEWLNSITSRDRRGRDRMVVGLITTITANVVNSNPTSGEVYSIQHCVIKFVSDLRKVGGFLQALRFSPPIKLTATI